MTSYLKVISLLIIPFIAGCSIVTPSTQNFHVSVYPDFAEVYVNDEYIGQGDVTTRVRGKDGAAVRLVAPGYIAYERYVHVTLTNSAVADVIGGWICLVPFVGLLFPGAHKLEKDRINVKMEAKDGLIQTESD